MKRDPITQFALDHPRITVETLYRKELDAVEYTLWLDNSRIKQIVPETTAKSMFYDENGEFIEKNLVRYLELMLEEIKKERDGHGNAQ